MSIRVEMWVTIKNQPWSIESPFQEPTANLVRVVRVGEVGNGFLTLSEVLGMQDFVSPD